MIDNCKNVSFEYDMSITESQRDLEDFHGSVLESFLTFNALEDFSLNLLPCLLFHYISEYFGKSETDLEDFKGSLLESLLTFNALKDFQSILE
ncbi:hypothetical protein YC2023_039635 [Brassica napus]